jgi:hypothetical protein
MKIGKKLLRKNKKLGTSPIIAVMMLIGLTVVSGAVLYSINSNILQTKDELGLNYSTPTVFKSTETNYKYADSYIDSFDIEITNPLYEQIIVDLSQTYLFNATDNAKLTNWYVDSSTSELLLFGSETAIITFTTINSLNSAELLDGDQVYVQFKIVRLDSEETKTIKTSTFSVSLSNFETNFEFIPSSTSVQDYNTMYFMADDDEQITTDIQGVLWNYGNPELEHAKTVTLYLGNESVFSVDPEFKTQLVTVPSSSVVGDQNELGVCEIGEACVNITFPVTKHNLVELNIESYTNTYGAFVSVSGLDLISFELKTTSPLIKITMENINDKGKSEGQHGKDNKGKNNQIYNTITFDEDLDEQDSKDVTFDIWNLDVDPREANIEIIGLNETVFTLTTKSQEDKYDTNPQMVNLAEGPGKSSKKDTNVCKHEDKQACESVTWEITRNKIVSHDELTGIEAGIYTVTIRDTITGIELKIDLVIPQYLVRFHIDSITVTGKGKGNNENNNELIIKLVDENSDPMDDLKVMVEGTYDNGKKFYENTKTDKNGEATYKLDNDKKINGITISKFTFEFEDKHQDKCIYLYYYDSSSTTLPVTYNF